MFTLCILFYFCQWFVSFIYISYMDFFSSVLVWVLGEKGGGGIIILKIGKWSTVMLGLLRLSIFVSFSLLDTL